MARARHRGPGAGRSRPLAARRAAGSAVAVALALAGATGALAAAGPGDAPDPARAARVLRSHTLRGLDGGTLPLASLAGEVVVVNFWASWCAPCRRELPRLAALHAELAGRGGRVVAISIDLEARNARRFLRERRLSLPAYHDGPDGLARALDLPHVPFTLVLDRDGSVVLARPGADERALEAVASTARRLLAAAPVAGGTP